MIKLSLLAASSFAHRLSLRGGIMTGSSKDFSLRVVSQATPIAERERVWSCCNYRVVAEECNYQTWQLGNKMLTSAKHMMYLYSMTTNAIYEEADLIGFCRGDNSMVVA